VNPSTAGISNAQATVKITLMGACVRDMGTHGSPLTRVPEVPAKWTRPASGPKDLIHKLGDLIQIPEDPLDLEHKAIYKIASWRRL
jgi:hypothetical protein